MHISDFDYELPEELIAQHPLDRRDGSRMLIVNRAAQSLTAAEFTDFPRLIRAGDVVVVNNTRVFPARLKGQRDPSGGRVEILLVREMETAIWEALVRPAHRLKTGEHIRFGDSGLHGEVIESSEAGKRRIRFSGNQSIETLLSMVGETPLPPYIRRPQGTTIQDEERYQTVFARAKGAVAAPTAGLHFTPEIIENLESLGATVVEVTLHVGYGTFEPVRVGNIDEHRVSSEFFQITDKAATAINENRARGGRVIAVGTTTTRALESATNAQGIIEPGKRETNLTIVPGYKFRAVNCLLTNFHLPRSSLLLLVSAFAGRDFALAAYRRAVEQRFRFYSYGDCMFVI
ncbi:MAG TPA: tRNA preQ1(34) S-adenosylmethionine ribosyltransferase-isomerase QueA [Pyrinomonadaceae bacterium]|nr:tRNA preQ1(34) S-adenosylmethionine ribosyltransferase-isomerase QueA [Pyrinomonadaceae bacterium]